MHEETDPSKPAAPEPLPAGNWGGDRSRLLSAALETAANAIFITDRRGLIEFVNPAFERLTGYSARDVLGRSPSLLKSGRQDADYYRTLWETILAGRPWQGRVVNRNRSGELFTVAQTVTPITDAEGRVTHFVAMHEDVTARVEAEQRLDHMARHDFLAIFPTASCSTTASSRRRSASAVTGARSPCCCSTSTTSRASTTTTATIPAISF